MRLVLGASRWRLGRQLLTESFVLYGIGAAIGVALAVWSSRILVEQLSTPTNTVFLDLSLDSRILGFTVALTMIATLIFGTAPALRASRVEPMDALKQQARTITGHRRITLAGSLIIVQVSLSLVLVVAAGLFVRTFSSLIRRPLGFEPRQVLIVNIDAHQTSNDPAQRFRLYERARNAVRRLPDVGEAALSLTTPIGAGQFTPPVEIDGVPDTRGPVWANLISPGWFATFQTPLIAGRDLTDRDRAGAPRVAVVNEAFALKFMGSGDPIGRTMKLYPYTALSLGPIEIVGVVGDAVYTSVRSAVPPTLYIPLAQFDHLTELGIRSVNLSVRSKIQPPMALAKGLTAALTGVNPQLALTFRPLVTQINASLTQERLIALLAGVFGALALLLAGIGLYGVTAYAVASRRTEISIRMALGAQAPRVFSLVVTRTSLLVGAGVLIGTGASVWASRFVGRMVYGLEPRDPMTLVSAIGLIVAVAALAASLPARRAVHIDPAAILRES